MKLVAFRIVNFRSIVDTGWSNLSSDNITGLVGQNESGKTAILEALYCFYTQELQEDYTRNDNVYPEISCSFETSKKEIESNFAETSLPDNFFDVLEQKGNVINITCEWNDGLKPEDSYLSLEQEAVKKLFTSEEEIANETAAEEAEKEDKKADDDGEQTDLTFEENEFAENVHSIIPEFVFFTNFASMLPSEIDVADIVNNNTETGGLLGAKNYLSIADIDKSLLENQYGARRRYVINQIKKANEYVTEDFQTFWSQIVGKENKITIELRLERHEEGEKAGKPYLEFWIHDSEGMLYPRQRSEGVRWFLSFFLQLRATQKTTTTGQLILIDEPGLNLHARAQEDVSRLFEDIKNALQIVYTTHSPYLIKTDTLYRLLAVQRSEDDTVSDTRVFDIHQLGAASEDTMFPVYTLIGADLAHQRAVKATNNILLEEPSGYYYLMAFKLLVDSRQEMNFLPATGVTNIPMFANLFLGWGLEFIVVTDNDDAGKRVTRRLKKDVFGGSEEMANARLHNILGDGIEDIFSKTSFKNHVLDSSSVDYTGTNSAYINTLSNEDSNFSKVYIAIRFYQKVKDGSVSLTDLSKKTQNNIKRLIQEVENMLKNYPRN